MTSQPGIADGNYWRKRDLFRTVRLGPEADVTPTARKRHNQSFRQPVICDVGPAVQTRLSSRHMWT